MLEALNRHEKLQKTRNFVLTLGLSQITSAVQQLRILLEEVRETSRRGPVIPARPSWDLTDEQLRQNGFGARPKFRPLIAEVERKAGI